MKLEDISFDLDDKNLFLVDNIKLKADAIRHSILPKLEIIANTTISLLNQVYRTDPLELSTIIKFPNFRKNRIKELAIDYIEAQAGLGPKRSRTLWTKVNKVNGEQPMILPFSLTYCLDELGLYFYFATNRYRLRLKDYSLFHSYHLNNKEIIELLMAESNVNFLSLYDDYKKFVLRPKSELFDAMITEGRWEFLIESKRFNYPIDSDDIMALVESFITFFPIYENYLNIAAGKLAVFDKNIDFLRDFLIKIGDPNIEEEIAESDISQYSKEHLLEIANNRIKVMPAMRWQVFQRDNWRCVACGRNSENGLILHIDHIIPRSKGGQDHLDNYQTLCETCNIGKSNRDQTNLRDRTN